MTAGTDSVGVSLNSTELSTNIGSITPADILFAADVTGTNGQGVGSRQVALKRGDALRAHTSGVAAINTAKVVLSITKVGVSQVTGVPFNRVAYVLDEKATTVQGDTLTSGIRNTRTINKLYGESGVVDIDSDQMIFYPGEYDVEFDVTHYSCNSARAFLYNFTDSVDHPEGNGTTCRAETSGPQNVLSQIKCRVSVDKVTRFEIQSDVQTTRSNGGGQRSDSASDSTPERYLLGKITRVK